MTPSVDSIRDANNSRNINKRTIGCHNLCVKSFTRLLQVSLLLPRHLHGPDTKISLKHTTGFFTVTYLIAVCFKNICCQLLDDVKIIATKHVEPI